MPDRFETRAKNPVAECLIRRLIVPRIYFDANWPGLPERDVDLLAIDRDGVGDAHIVMIRRRAADALTEVSLLLQAQAPFRWVAFEQNAEDEASRLALVSQEILYPPANIPGRVGVIEMVNMAGGDHGANVRISAERFAQPMYEVATEFSGSHRANIEFGG